MRARAIGVAAAAAVRARAIAVAARSRAIAVAAAAGAATLLAARRRTGGRPAAAVRIVDPEGPPRFDPRGGARSVQAAVLTLSPAQLTALWSPVGLERLARTYWRFLTRISLGLIRVRYRDRERLLVLGGRPLVLLAFDPPEYELDDDRAAVGWTIRGGLLLAAGGRPGRGSLHIDVRRLGTAPDGSTDVRCEVAVTDFLPSIARFLGRRVYVATQSRIHVVITHAFLRSLARVDLARAARGRQTGG